MAILVVNIRGVCCTLLVCFRLVIISSRNVAENGRAVDCIVYRQFEAVKYIQRCVV